MHEMDLHTRPDPVLILQQVIATNNADECLSAAKQLVRIGDERAVTALDALYGLPAVQSNEILRARVVKTISRMNNPGNIPILCAALADAEGYVRKSAIEATRHISDAAVIEGIVDRLDDEDLNIRESAAGALKGKVTECLAVRLIRRLDDPHWSVRREIVEALGAQEFPGIREALRRVVFEDNDGEVRREALARLSVWLDQDERLELISQVLKDRDAGVRLEAIHILKNTGSERAASLLLGIAGDPNPTVAKAAGRALEHLTAA